MARSRIVKPEFFQHAELFDAERSSGFPLRVAFAGLWCQADREGRFVWKPRQLKLHILPYDEVDFSDVLDALERAGFIQSYVVDGRRYGVIPTFADHQSFHHRELQSKLPVPPDTEPASSKEMEGTARAKPGQGRTQPRASRTASASISASTSASAGDDEAVPPATPPPRRGTSEPLSRCRREVPNAYRPALEGALRSARHPEAIAAELCALADGMRGTPPPTWEHLGLALHDLAVAGSQITANTLRAFARKARDGAGTMRDSPAGSSQPATGDSVDWGELERAERERQRQEATG